MKFKKFVSICILSVLGCWAGGARAAVSFMPVDDLRPGMQGIGKTVISGDKIEDFNVEILGVNGTVTSGESIFVRLSGDVIDKTGGVIHGMSGSPVYVDGRLVGAIAFGRAFDDAHYCFLTPIHQMLDLVDEVHYPSDWLPKGTALSAGGFTDEGFEYLQKRLAKYDLQAVPGGSGAAVSSDFQAGSSVGVSLMNGDLSLGAIGTVTWVDDAGNLLAFGHPFLKRGMAQFFMNKVWILGTVPNQNSGYKVGNLGDVAGTVNQDRAAGVCGKVGDPPKSVPVVVNISDFDRGNYQSLNMRIVEDQLLLPELVDAAVYNSLSKATNRAGGGTAALKFTVEAKTPKGERYKVNRENMFFGVSKLLKNIDDEMLNSLDVLMWNKFDKLDVERIVVDAKITEDLRVAEVKEVSVPKRPYRGGDTVPVIVTLKPYRGPDVKRVIDFKIPEKHKGKLTVCVRGGSSLLWLERLLKKNQDEQLPLQSKESKQALKDYVEHLNTGDKNNELIIDVGGKNLSVLAKKNEAGLAGLLQGTPAKVKQAYDFIVMGEIELSFDVK